MFRLMVVTDRRRSARPITETVRLALEGGADAIQLRERDISDRDLFRLAEEMRRITAEAGASLIINHRTDVAIASEADGVHLGWRSVRVGDARALCGDSLRIGVSCHSAGQLRTAEKDGADYVLLGPIFSTPSKRGLVEPLGLEATKEIVSGSDLPMVAIGGITSENAGQVRETGTCGVAVVSAIVAADDPRSAAHELVAAFGRP